MNVARKLGIVVFFAVPAIVGGGIVYWASGSYVPVAIYQILLVVLAGGIISK